MQKFADAPPPPQCIEQLKSQGKPYPRTCSICGLGPCQKRFVTDAVNIPSNIAYNLPTVIAVTRESIAKDALIAIITGSDILPPADIAAGAAVEYADALLSHLAKPRGK